MGFSGLMWDLMSCHDNMGHFFVGSLEMDGPSWREGQWRECAVLP